MTVPYSDMTVRKRKAEIESKSNRVMADKPDAIDEAERLYADDAEAAFETFRQMLSQSYEDEW